MCTGGGQKVISFMSFFQTGKSCAPCSSLEADNKQTYAEPWPYKWEEGMCVCAPTCIKYVLLKHPQKIKAVFLHLVCLVLIFINEPRLNK